MQLIKPSQISGEIMTLLEEADKKVILVTPYFKVQKWYKLKNKFELLKNRQIDIDIYIREHESDSEQEVLDLGFKPNLIPNLHTKLYLNEKYAIVSSMNLLLSSDTNSLDIALRTESESEYNQIFEYYLRYIKGALTLTSHKGFDNWREELEIRLSKTAANVNIKESNNCLQINTGSRYEVFIEKKNGYKLIVNGILSSKDYSFAFKNKKMLLNDSIKIDIVQGHGNYYNTAWGIIEDIKTKSINQLMREEEEKIIQGISSFVQIIENIKRQS